MATQAAPHKFAPPHSYVNVAPSGAANGQGPAVVDLTTAPTDRPPQRYMNVALQEQQPGVSARSTSATPTPTLASTYSATIPNGHAQDVASQAPPLNTPGSSVSPPTHARESQLRRHCSEVGFKPLEASTQYDTPSPRRTSADQAVSDAKLQLLMSNGVARGSGRGEGGGGGGGPELPSGCKNCDQMSRLLDTWEIGVSSLTRNYSRILAHLIKTRNSTIALESRLKESSSPPQIRQKKSKKSSQQLSNQSPPTPTRVPKVRQSMFINNGPAAITSVNAHDQDLAENMYPTRKARSGALTNVPPPPSPSPNTIPPECVKDFKDLNSHLEEAIELCQQLAAACFKTNYLSSLTGKRSHANPLGSRSHHDLGAGAGGGNRKLSAGTPPNLSYKPSLHSITEMKLTKSLQKRKATLERVPSAPNLEYSCELSSSSGSRSSAGSDIVENGFVNVHKTDIPDAVTKAASPTNCVANGSHDDHMTDSSSESTTPPNTDEDMEGDDGLELGQGGERDSGLGTGPLEYRPESLLSSTSTYSESDVKCVMSKIATLEEERYKLLETIDTLQEDNSTVRLSLHEILSDLENKDLQLTLAMQDLSIATGEIKKVAGMRRKLDELSSERDQLLERLGDLEDESSAVKVSLIQLLQEKSATNKTLALENCRLAERVRQGNFRGNPKSSVPEATPMARSPTGDNVSMHSAYSVATEDTTLQEAYMGAAMGENFVHKQGFLIKQGGKVKNWKKRLFVLNTEGLAYYKTESPVQTVPIERIDKVGICHKNCAQPHMFEVHTQGRTFLLSAPTADEMQSWVGMLETLKQYKRATTLHREATLRNQLLTGERAASPDSDAAIISSPERDTPSPEPEEARPHPVGGASGGHQQQELAYKVKSFDLDEDDDMTYLHQLKKGHNMSAPAHHDAGLQSNLLASLDLHM